MRNVSRPSPGFQPRSFSKRTSAANSLPRRSEAAKSPVRSSGRGRRSPLAAEGVCREAPALVAVDPDRGA